MILEISVAILVLVTFCIGWILGVATMVIYKGPPKTMFEHAMKLKRDLKGHISDPEDHPMFLLLLVCSTKSDMYASYVWDKPRKSLENGGYIVVYENKIMSVTASGLLVAMTYCQDGTMPWNRDGTLKKND